MGKAIFVDDDPDLIKSFHRVSRGRELPLDVILFEIGKEINIPPETPLVICDGLNGLWRQIYQKTRGHDPKIQFVLYTTDNPIIEAGRKEGIPVVLKEPGKNYDQINAMLTQYLE